MMMFLHKRFKIDLTSVGLECDLSVAIGSKHHRMNRLESSQNVLRWVAECVPSACAYQSELRLPLGEQFSR